MNEYVEFDKYGLHFKIYRLFRETKDTFEYTALVTTLLHNFRERFDFELSQDSFGMNQKEWINFAKTLPPISEKEKDLALEYVMLDIIDYAAMVHHLDESHSRFYEFSPVLSPGTAKEYNNKSFEEQTKENNDKNN